MQVAERHPVGVQVVPGPGAVANPAQQAELRGLIDMAMDDGTASWWLAGDGTWTRHHLDPDGKSLRDLQQHLIAARRARPADG